MAYRDPFSALQQELERMLGSAFGTFGPSGVYPPVDVFDTGDEFLVKAELPGVSPQDIEVSFEGDALTLRGERKLATPEADAAYHRRERSEGRFRRVVRLPGRVAGDAVGAEVRDGVLTIHVPKAAEQKPRRVDVRVA
jgi:HSP20 family protein